jgi:hypothetical protein
MFNHLVRISRDLILVVLFASFAWAQMEIDPDHYPDESSPTRSEHDLKLLAQIQILQARIEGYEAQLRAKAEMMEEARQEAISAGIQGDGAGTYVEVYRQQQKEFDSLRKSVASDIAMAQDAIASLQPAQGPLVATERASGKPSVVTTKASAPFLLSSRRSIHRTSVHR